MSPILYDICKDAISKSAAASDEDKKLLSDAAANALMLAGKARREGLLALEKAAAVQPVRLPYLNHLIELIVDGREPEMVLEIAANAYWSRNPQGIHAMVHYFYIRSMLLAQAGEDPHLTEELFLSLIPQAWQTDFRKRSALEKERLEAEEQKTLTEAFAGIHPSFQNAGLQEELRALETEIMGFFDATVQRLLRETDMETLTVCLYAFQDGARKKIMNNISRSRSEMLMQEAVWRTWRGTVAEEEVLSKVRKVNSVIFRLRESREIVE